MARKAAEAAEATPESGTRFDRVLSSEVVAKMQQKWGSTALIRASTDRVQIVPRIPTGIFLLDYALGGGWPAGRINTIYGNKSSSKTTTLIKTIAQAQKMCFNCYNFVLEPGVCSCNAYREAVCAFVDVEGTWDAAWASTLGVDLTRLLYSRPEYAEQSLDTMEGLVRSGDVDVVVLDSIAFLTPQKEIEESVDKETMGVQPRLIGKGMRKLTSALSSIKNDHGRFPTIFLTNQIRMKLGVMFGCFHGDTPVMMADGTQVPIATVVREKLVGPVLSWDGEKIVERSIKAWHQNGTLDEQEEWLTFRTQGTGGRRGAIGFTCTPNHVLVRANGDEVHASDVRVGDPLLSWEEQHLTNIEKDVIVGSLFGDGTISETGVFKLCNSEQAEYVEWKASFFSSLGFRKSVCSDRSVLSSEGSWELRQLRKLFYGTETTLPSKDYRTIPLDVLRAATARRLAIWYCDDGNIDLTRPRLSISVKRLLPEHAEKVAVVLNERFRGVSYSPSQRSLLFPGETANVFMNEISDFVPKCMSYKLSSDFQHRATAIPFMEFEPTKRVVTSSKVIEIKVSRKKRRSPTKYDLTIEGNSYYLVGGDSRGVVVHNSPEVQPGGNAPGFAATTEVKVWPGKYEMDDVSGRPLHVDVNFRVEKNKSGPAKMEGSYRLMLSSTETKKVGDVYDENEVLKFAQKFGLLEGSGSSWTCLGEKYGGRSVIERKMLTEPAFGAHIRETLMKILLTA